MELLIGLIRLRVDIDAVAQTHARAAVERLVSFWKELEGEFKMRLRLPAIRVKVAGAERQSRIRRQKPPGLGRKDIRVAPDFVNGPAGGALVNAIGPTALNHAGIRHVVKHETSTNRIGSPTLGNIVDLSDLDGGGVPIFSETRWDESNISPFVGPNSRDYHVLRPQHQIRFPDRPLVGAVELTGRRHIVWIASWGPAICPFRNLGDLLVAQ